MKTLNERLKRRLVKNRPMITVSVRIPQDLIEDMDELAPAFGLSGHQSLIRAYIGEGLRRDEARMDSADVQALTDSLRKQGVAD